MTGGDTNASVGDLFDQLMLSQTSIARITPESIGSALEGFALPLPNDLASFARSVQAAVAIGTMTNDGDPDRKSNAEVRDELAALAKRASDLSLALSTRSGQADSALWDFAFQDWLDDRAIDDGALMGESHRLKAFSDAEQALAMLHAILLGAATHIGNQIQSGPWRASQRLRRRIDLAMCLSPVFEKTFGQAATPSNDGPLYGHWGDFYQRIMAVAFKEQATPNLETVLKEARRRSLASPVLFAPGIMPD